MTSTFFIFLKVRLITQFKPKTVSNILYLADKFTKEGGKIKISWFISNKRKVVSMRRKTTMNGMKTKFSISNRDYQTIYR
jgi:hypothetical protein